MLLFIADEEVTAALYQLLHGIVETTLQMGVQLNGSNQLAEKSDVFEGFFNVLSQISKRSSQFIFASGVDCNSLFQCGKTFAENAV